MDSLYNNIENASCFSMNGSPIEDRWASICADLYGSSPVSSRHETERLEPSSALNSIHSGAELAMMTIVFTGAGGDSNLNQDQFGMLPDTVADALRQIGAKSISVTQNGDRKHVQVPLSKDYYYNTGEAAVPQVWLDKSKVRLDMELKKDGTIELTNISGVGVKVDPQSKWAPSFWVYPKNATISAPVGDGDASASITVTKLGVTRTQSVTIPRASYESLRDTVRSLK